MNYTTSDNPRIRRFIMKQKNRSYTGGTVTGTGTISGSVSISGPGSVTGPVNISGDALIEQPKTKPAEKPPLQNKRSD
jgi:hypothetical protein